MQIPSDPNDPRHKLALFRHSVVSSLLHRNDGETLQDLMQRKSEQRYDIPGSTRTHIAIETMRDWLRAYRKGGYEALLPKVRTDTGQARAIPEPIADLLCHLKEENPLMTVPLVIAAARDQGGVSAEVTLAPSTVHRLLTSKGLMRKHPTEPTSKDRRKFVTQFAGDLWMSDVMHGIAVCADARRKQKTYLIAIIDDASRLVPHAEFTFSENTETYLPILEQAIRRRGIPLRLYVDNGSVFRSNHLALVCAKLGITLIHSRPYVPQGRGKIERFFRTVRLQFMPTITEEHKASLTALNRAFAGWLQGEYHQNPHKGIDGLTPMDAWARTCESVRLPDSTMKVDDLFLFEEKRKVAADRTISLKGTLYEVDAALVGQTVTLRFDPSKLGRPIMVLHNGRPSGIAKVVDAYANCHVKRDYHTRATVASKPAQTPQNALRMSDLDDKDIF
jgi:transposase InsO family protein